MIKKLENLLIRKLISPLIKDYNLFRDDKKEGKRYYLYYALSPDLPENYKKVCNEKEANIVTCDYYLDEKCLKTCNFYKKHRIKIGWDKMLRKCFWD